MNLEILQIVDEAGCRDRWMDDALAKVEKVEDLHTFNSSTDGALEPSSIGVDRSWMEELAEMTIERSPDGRWRCKWLVDGMGAALFCGWEMME